MSDSSPRDFLASSGIAFSGSVVEVGASSVPGLPVDDRTVIVRVDETLAGPPDLLIPAGSRVTVQLSAELPVLQPGSRAVFFANGLAYGESMAVSEVARMPVEQDLGALRLQGGAEASGAIEDARAELAQEEVLQHARSASVVARGQVVSLAAVSEPQARHPREHDPDWWVATLAVDLVVKGDVPGLKDGIGTVNVLYANSLDSRWRESPKPKASQGGVWLLHDTGPENAHLAPLQILHKIDLQPSIQVEFFQERGV